MLRQCFTTKVSRSLLVSLAILTLAACSNVNESPTQGKTPDFETINASLETMAKTFAKAMETEEVRQQIHTRVGERFDGDTSVLYDTLVSQSRVQREMHQQATGIRQALAHAYADGMLAGQSLSSVEASSMVARLVDNIPRFQVSVPSSYESWNPQSFTPLVGYVPVGIEDTVLTTIKAFDADGQMHLLDAQHAPEQPVIILGVSERTDDKGEVLPQYGPGASGSGGVADPMEVAPQSCIKNAYMEKVYLNKDHEPWIKGDPEVMLIAASTNKDLSYHAAFLGVNDEDKWYTYHRYLGCTSADVIFYWYEDDGGSLDLTVSYKGFSLGVKIDDDDDFMGAIQVPYSRLDRTPSYWNVGSLKFYSN